MSGYEIEELGRIEDAIDALESPTSEDVFQALRPFDERAIGSVAAQRAGAGGGSLPDPIPTAVTIAPPLGTDPILSITDAAGPDNFTTLIRADVENQAVFSVNGGGDLDLYIAQPGTGMTVHVLADANPGHVIAIRLNATTTFVVTQEGLITTAGGVIFPDSDPHVAGAWWDNAGTLTRSSG